MEGPNGIGLSPDGQTLYVAETPTGRVWALDIVAPGQIGQRHVLGTVPGAAPLNLAMCDSLCVDGDGNVIVATLVNGGLTTISPNGTIIRHTPCAGCAHDERGVRRGGLRTLYVTLSTTGKLVAFDQWPERGLKLHFQA